MGTDLWTLKYKLFTEGQNTMRDKKEGESVKIEGKISSYRVVETRNNGPMAFCALTYQSRIWQVVVFSDLYAKTKQIIKNKDVVTIEGEIDRSNEMATVLANRLTLNG